MTHSPGPWELSAGDVWATSPLNARVKILSVLHHAPMNGIDSAANGCLATAAPDLLEALRNLAFHASACCSADPSDMQREIIRMSVDRANAVIAKATEK